MDDLKFIQPQFTDLKSSITIKISLPQFNKPGS